MRFVFYDKTPQSPYASGTVTVTIPAGTAPFVYNHTCPLCYTLGEMKLAVSVNYVGDTSTKWPVTFDYTIMVTSMSYSQKSPAFKANLYGLTVGNKYYVVVGCETPLFFFRIDVDAVESYPTVDGTMPQYPCTGTLYASLSSADNVRVGIMSS